MALEYCAEVGENVIIGTPWVGARVEVKIEVKARLGPGMAGLGLELIVRGGD